MDKQKEELSYFRLRLLELLRTSFPEKSKDKTFISQRAQRAANVVEVRVDIYKLSSYR